MLEAALWSDISIRSDLPATASSVERVIVSILASDFFFRNVRRFSSVRAWYGATFLLWNP